ncbi:MAG: hypothetical protein PHR77_04115 [Kiritimatiellae bacterium]|nr:hypothetical protein [Kiritimatiellia bacterium]MDD5519352.1 hypothetical protein [Kiritimatiellia bacterium]
MPDIRFNCPMCNQQLEAPGEYADQVIECPACQKPITVPGVEPVEQAEPLKPAEQAVSGNKCPECGGTLEEGVVLCIKCGFHLKLGKKIATDFK